MNQNVIKNVRIIELVKEELTFSKLKFRYIAEEHYAVAVFRKKDGWEIKLVLGALPEPIEKRYEGGLFQDFVDEPRVLPLNWKANKLVGLNWAFKSGTTECASGSFWSKKDFVAKE